MTAPVQPLHCPAPRRPGQAHPAGARAASLSPAPALRGAFRCGSAGLAGFALVLSLLAGCVSPGGGGAEPPASPITGDAIEVSALGPPPAVPGGAGDAGTAAAAPVPPPPSQPAAALAGDAASAPEPVPETGSQAAPVAAPAAAAVKSAAQRACENRKGQWSGGASGIGTCVFYTRDSAKRCTKAGDCEGECLARSGSCAPITPLYGCNEILDNIGRRMTQCLQ